MRRLTLSLAVIPLALANLGAHCSGAPRYQPYAQGQAPCSVPNFKPHCPAGTRLEVRHQGRACELACRDTARRYHGPYGRLYRYSSNNTQIEIGAFRQGRRHGIFRTTRIYQRYKRVERVVSETRYKAGTLHGATRQLRDGQLISVTTYRHGVRHGREASWDSTSGMLTHSRHYQDGRLHGRWKQRRGNVMIDGAYRDGLPHGRFTVTSASGKAVGTFTFNDGVGSWQRFLLDGTVIESKAMRFGMSHGPYRTFHPSGRPHQIGSYHRNQRDGLWCTFDVRGRLTYSEQRSNGALIRRSGTDLHNPGIDDDRKRCVTLGARLVRQQQQQQQQRQQQQRQQRQQQQQQQRDQRAHRASPRGASAKAAP